MAPTALCTTELRGSPEELRKILHPKVVVHKTIVTLSGSAEEKAYSDKAIISLVVLTEGENISSAISSNNRIRTEIEKKLLLAGIPQEEIKSSRFSTSPQYGWFGDKPKSYQVVNRMAIGITNENQLKEIAVASDLHKEADIADTVFEHTEKEAYLLKVKNMALDKIMDQKSVYKKSLGLKLKPVTFRDAKYNYGRSRGAYVLEEVVVTARKKSFSSAKKESVLAPKRTPSFDEVKYNASISVDFEILPE